MSKRDAMYISIIIPTRLDDYGKNQLLRMELYFKYLAKLIENYWFNIKYEVIIVDCNPTSETRLLISILDKININYRILSFFTNKKHESLFDLHKSVNFGVINSSANFILVTNYDCYPTNNIFEFIGNRKLKNNKIYLSDRFDINLSKISLKNEFELLNEILNSSNGIMHVSHGLYFDSENKNVISLEIKGDDQKRFKIRSSKIDKFVNDYLLIWKKLTRLKVFKFLLIQSLKQNFNLINDLIYDFRIHTNGSGDFILISKKKFIQLRGFDENIDTYWHLDSDLVLRSIFSGMSHAQFTGDAYVRHIVTQGSGGTDSRYRSKSYDEMSNHWKKLILKKFHLSL